MNDKEQKEIDQAIIESNLQNQLENAFEEALEKAYMKDLKIAQDEIKKARVETAERIKMTTIACDLKARDVIDECDKVIKENS